jgi:uncharacterized protein (TIGR00297 family)
MIPFVLAYGWASNLGRLAIAGAVTVGFAMLARGLRGVNRSGMFAGSGACFLLYAGTGPPAFAALVALFLLTWLSTRLGYRTKHQLGIAEHREGRNGWQVSANLAVAALGSVLFSATGSRVWLLAAAAALAEAATDTVASEIGQTRSRTAILITTWETVPAGTDGGITIPGTIAGTVAACTVAVVAALSGMIPRNQFWVPATAGVAGMLVDSVLGATCQRRRWMNNETVNLFGTLAAAALGYAISMFAKG